MVNYNKRGISPVIATILLLAITVIIAVGVYQFLNTYTQDTFDSISGDSTVSLAFANQVNMYESDSGNNVTVFIAKTTYPETLNFDRFVFQGPSGTVTCNQTGGYNVNHSISNEFNFLIQNTTGSDCNNNFAGGKYDLLMIGNTPVEVRGIDFSR